MYKTYELVCNLPARIAAKRIGGLLSKEGVDYTATDLSISSVRTPIAVFWWIQPKLYSRNNRVGLNPFVFVSGVDLRFMEGENGLTRVTVRVNRFRTLLWVVSYITCSGFAAVAMPELWGAIALIAGVACAAWLGIVEFLGGYLIKKEIADRLTGC